MPENAEVALTAQILLKYLKNKKLVSFDFIAGRYTKTSPVGYDDFVDDLPLKVKNIDSKGKFMWFDLAKPKDSDQHWYIWNTFGLTGMWSLYEPKYAKAVLTFSNGIVVYYSDLRNFGTFKFSTNEEDLEKKLNSLGSDFLKDDDHDFSKIKKYKMPIAKILMDQKKIGSGLGNYLVAEILYRAKISPHRLGSDLTDEEIDDLEYWIKYIVKLSYLRNHIGYMVNLKDEVGKIKKINYHPDIKLKDKTFKFLVYGKKTDPHGNEVITESIARAGTNTYWVPDVQQ